MTLTHSADVDLLISQHKWREALSALDSMSRSKSNGGAPLDDLTSLPRKCLCLAHLGRHREALQLVQVPLEKRRGWAAGWLAKAKVLLDLGRYQEALDCLEDDGKSLPAPFLLFRYAISLWYFFGVPLAFSFFLADSQSPSLSLSLSLFLPTYLCLSH